MKENLYPWQFFRVQESGSRHYFFQCINMSLIYFNRLENIVVAREIGTQNISEEKKKWMMARMIEKYKSQGYSQVDSLLYKLDDLDIDRVVLVGSDTYMQQM